MDNFNFLIFQWMDGIILVDPRWDAMATCIYLWNRLFEDLRIHPTHQAVL